MSPAMCIHDQLAESIGRPRSHEIARKKPHTIVSTARKPFSPND
jgi:hypothetical protein